MSRFRLAISAFVFVFGLHACAFAQTTQTEPPVSPSSGLLGTRAPGNLIRNEIDRHNSLNDILFNPDGFHGDFFPNVETPSLEQVLSPDFIPPAGTGGVFDPVIPQDDLGEALLQTLVQAFFGVIGNISALFNFLDLETFFVDLLQPGAAAALSSVDGISTTAPDDFVSTLGQ
jgi:hypothetical protein